MFPRLQLFYIPHISENIQYENILCLTYFTWHNVLKFPWCWCFCLFLANLEITIKSTLQYENSNTKRKVWKGFCHTHTHAHTQRREKKKRKKWSSPYLGALKDHSSLSEQYMENTDWRQEYQWAQWNTKMAQCKVVAVGIKASDRLGKKQSLRINIMIMSFIINKE